MDTVIITAATAGELAVLVRKTGAQQFNSRLPVDLYVFTAGGKRIIFAETGIGKALAASATTALINGFSPDMILNTGCAGAYAVSGLKAGGLALATSEFFADDGVETPGGWQSLEEMGFALWERNGRCFGNEIPLTASLVEKARRIADRDGFQLKAGKFLTVSTCSGSRMRGDTLAKRYGGICENMEGAAVALIAAIYGIPCMEVRGISNLVEDRDLSRWNIPSAVAAASNFIERILESL